MQEESPFNSVPPAALVLAIGIAVIELVLMAAANGIVGGPQGIGWRIAASEDFSFFPAILTEIFERGRGTVDLWKRFVTYAFVQPTTTHAVFAVVMLLALGKFVGEVLHPIAFLILFFAASIGGAAVYGVISPANVRLIGAYPAVYGLIGAYTYLMWLKLGQLGANQLKAFQLIGVLMALLVIYSVMFGNHLTWIAEVAGFFIGLFCAPLLAPGGWQAFLNRIRTRS